MCEHSFDKDMKCRNCGLTHIEIDKLTCQIYGRGHPLYEDPPIPCEVIRELKEHRKREIEYMERRSDL
jgi:hypothetical protein